MFHDFFEITEKRQDKLADYILNLSVASFAVGAFSRNWAGIVGSVIFLLAFYYITGEK